jgi:hypothetical protein
VLVELKKRKEILVDELWTLMWVHAETEVEGDIIPPYDSNPGCSDEGMLVYRSEKAATLSAEHQTDLYGDSENVAKVIPLAVALRKLKARS